MRLGKRERRALRELKRLKRLERIRAAATPIDVQADRGKPLVRTSLISLTPSAGTSNPGANLLRYESKKDKPSYQVDREPRIKALTGKVQGGKVVSSSTVKRFATV